MKRIKIAEPQFDYPEVDAIRCVFSSRRLAQGPEVEAFEAEFAKYCGAKHAVAVGNGTQALHLALLAYGVGCGDTVMIPAFSFIATASTVVMCDARPVFVDVCEDTGCMDVAQAGRMITDSDRMIFPRVIVPVHLYGHPAQPPAEDYSYSLSENRDSTHHAEIVYDACQAHGAKVWKPSKQKWLAGGIRCEASDLYSVGTMGTSVWSFYATKNMTTGEGGMITTDNPDVATRLRLLRNHGQTSRYTSSILGYNFRMTEMQAAIGRVQLCKLPEMQRSRVQNAVYLTENLRDLDGIMTPYTRPGCIPAWHQYTIRVATGRDDLASYLADREIETGIYYPTPLHLQPVFAHLKYRRGDFPVAEKLSTEVLSLPVHPGLSREDLDRIVSGVREWVEREK